MPGQFILETMRQKHLLIFTVITLTLSLLCTKLVIQDTSHSSLSTDMSEPTCTSATKNYGSDRIVKPPNMLVLQSVRLFDEIARDDAIKLGTFLLDDETGNKVNGLADMARSVEDLNRQIFQRWLKGDGKQPTNWDTLIGVLRKIKLHELADQIEQKVVKECRYEHSLPYDHSEMILKTVKRLKLKYLEQSVILFDLLKQQENMPFLDIVMRRHLHLVHTGSHEHLLSVLNEFTNSKRLLIVGKPGSGKTTLIRYLSKMWAEGELLQSCQILFVLYLGECKGEYHNLSDLLNVAYKDMGIPFEEISQRNGEGTCLLMDAFDEKLNKRDYVYKLMHNNELPLSGRILTSRPDDDLMTVTNSYEIIGYELHKLDTYLDQLTTNEVAKRIVQKLWKDRELKEMCQLPLHMAMVVFIAQTKHASSIKTTTQIYTAFMNATIKHYKRSHPQWNTVSLRECILEKSRHHDDKLCNAFKDLHTVAFQKTINRISTFYLKVEVREEINKLGFVSVFNENSASDEVSILFSHRTFAEFFTAIHVLTLPLDDQIFIVQNIYSGVISKFYFGLLGNFHSNNFTAVSLPFKYFSARWEYPCSKYLTDSTECESNLSQCHFLEPLSILEEIGWTGNSYRKLLNSAGIIANSSACVTMAKYEYSYGNLIYSIPIENSVYCEEFLYLHCLLQLHYFKNFIENSHVHSLTVIMSHSSNYHYVSPSPLTEITMYNPDHYLNTMHLQLLKCFDNKTCSVSREIRSALKYCHFLFRSKDNNDIMTTISTIKRLQEMFSVQSLIGLTLHFSEHFLRGCDDSAQKELWNYLNNLNISTLNVAVHLGSLYGCNGDASENLRTFTNIMPHITTLTITWQLYFFISSCRRQKFTSLSSVLKRPDKLKTLEISGQIPSERFNLSTILIGLTSLEYLKIHGNYKNKIIINETVVNQLLVTESKTLVGLDLSYCTLDRSAVNSLAKKFHFFLKLQTLDLSFSSLAGSDLNILSKHMTYLHSLRRLALAENEINGDELPSLVMALKTIENFQYLDLYLNPITGTENIESLAQLTNLHSLYITVVTKEDMKTLFKVTRSLPALVSFRWACYRNPCL